PRGEGSMNRSYAAATVELSSGRKARLVNVHLTHRESDTATRLAQIKALLKANSRPGPTVIAGDFNSVPGSEEIALLRDAGLVSAQDNTGNGDLLTSPTDRPQHRVDWIFGTPDVHFDDFARPRVTASDHFPLAVTARLG
ncbi:MAG: endonuclease/exonuclease/phosphatase family protein, partial [Micromonosporaceae bacterium]